MKSKFLVLSLLGMLSLYGCSLPDPLDLVVRCSDDTHGLTAVVYQGIRCHAEDVTGEKKEVCGKFADAFEHGYCPPESPNCINDQEGSFTCNGFTCEIGFHEYHGECEQDSSQNCGQHGYACEKLHGWLSGRCESGEVGIARCVATACKDKDGYRLDEKEKTCVSKIDCPVDSHVYVTETETMECEVDSLLNCGHHGNACASTEGWGNGACTKGVCIPSECQIGYHLDEGSCVADDSNNCGGVGEKCGQGQVCTKGNCSDNCGNGEVRCEKDGTVSCADPNTSTTFCGADASCSGYETCEYGQACVGGECVQNSCTKDNETLCVVNGENVCINVNSDDPNHCGACNLKCSDRPMANASSTTCSNGQCQYECATGYTNCGTSTVPNCINTANFQNDPNNCGSCGKICNADEFCNAGVCQKSTCTNQCLSNGTCVNTNDKCGTQCINCNSANNAASGTCNAGTCTITSCMTGFHLTTDKTCELNTPTSCGSTNKADVVNCTKHDHASDGYCKTNGQCVATSCETGYHVVEGVCVEDSPTACGAGATDCTKLDGWKNGMCENGQCKATVCQSNYCLNATTCVDGAYNASMCGINGTACISCDTSSQSCVNGLCVISGCDPNVCFYQGLTCSNTTEHCGKNCVNCNTANNASAGTCNVSAGTCTITNCKSGFHKSGTSCVANTATSCAPTNSSAAVNCMMNGHATDGDCNENGQCVAKSCETGYHVVDGTCVQDSVTACGARPINCTKLDGWGSGGCEKGRCVATACATGYTLSGGQCVESGGSGCKDHYITMNLEGRDVTAYCIETLEDLNNVYKGKIDAEAYALMEDFNLDELGADTWKPFFADGFSGIFFGNRKTLSGNLSCSSDCGVFGPLMRAKILDLNLDVMITGYGKARIGAVSVWANNAVLKNITSSGLLRSEEGRVGGLVVSATNKTTVESCHVTSDIEVRPGGISSGAGGLVHDSNQASVIANSSYEGNMRTNDGGVTGGLVGMLSEASVIESSYVGEKSEIQSTAEGKTENLTGGLVGSVWGKDNRISMSYFAGRLISNAKVGGLVGMVRGGLKIEKSVVFGNITGMESAFDAVGGLIGLIEADGEVIIQSSASVGDIDAKSKTVAGIAHITNGSLTIYDLYTFGNLIGNDSSYDDIVLKDSKASAEFYVSWMKRKQYFEDHDFIDILDDSLIVRDEKLEILLSAKSVWGEEAWKSHMCMITSGPAQGRETRYNLPLPQDLPLPSFCE